MLSPTKASLFHNEPAVQSEKALYAKNEVAPRDLQTCKSKSLSFWWNRPINSNHVLHKQFSLVSFQVSPASGVLQIPFLGRLYKCDWGRWFNRTVIINGACNAILQRLFELMCECGRTHTLQQPRLTYSIFVTFHSGWTMHLSWARHAWVVTGLTYRPTRILHSGWSLAPPSPALHPGFRGDVHVSVRFPPQQSVSGGGGGSHRKHRFKDEKMRQGDRKRGG